MPKKQMGKPEPSVGLGDEATDRVWYEEEGRDSRVLSGRK